MLGTAYSELIAVFTHEGWHPTSLQEMMMPAAGAVGGDRLGARLAAHRAASCVQELQA